MEELISSSRFSSVSCSLVGVCYPLGVEGTGKIKKDHSAAEKGSRSKKKGSLEVKINNCSGESLVRKEAIVVL